MQISSAFETTSEFEDIIHQLQGFIEDHSMPPQDWYVGLASDLEEELFSQHRVHRQLNSWIYRVADSSDAARLIHEVLLQLGCDGVKYLDEPKGNIVYAYLKSMRTRPSRACFY